MSPDLVLLAVRIKQYMENENLSIEEFADKVDVDRSCIFRITTGKTKRLHSKTLKNIRAVLGPEPTDVSADKLALIGRLELGEQELRGLLKMQQFLKRSIKIEEIPEILSIVLSTDSKKLK